MNVVSATALATTLTLFLLFGSGVSWSNRDYDRKLSYAWAWWAVWLWFGTITAASWYLVSRLM